MAEQIAINNQDSLRGKFSLSPTNQYFEVFAYFKDSSGNPISVSTPVCTITDAKTGATVVTGTPTLVGIGYYKFSFYAAGFAAGLYNVMFTGTIAIPGPATQTLVVGGQIGLQEITILQSFVNDIKYHLYEVDGTWLQYELDEPVKYWTDEMIYRAIMHTMQIVNETPPMITQWTVENVPCPGILSSGATAHCLLMRARFEDANTMSYTDAGKSLAIQRGQFYRTMAEEYTREFRGTGGANGGGVLGFKYAYRPRAIGLKAQRLPFKILRPLSMLPNMKNIFGL